MKDTPILSKTKDQSSRAKQGVRHLWPFLFIRKTFTGKGFKHLGTKERLANSVVGLFGRLTLNPARKKEMELGWVRLGLAWLSWIGLDLGIKRFFVSR